MWLRCKSEWLQWLINGNGSSFFSPSGSWSSSFLMSSTLFVFSTFFLKIPQCITLSWHFKFYSGSRSIFQSEHKPGRLCFSSAAPVRGIHRLCVLGQGLHGNPLGAGSGGGCTVSSKLLLLGGHAPSAPVPRGGHHKRSCWPAQVQVSASFDFCHLNWLAWYCREKICRCPFFLVNDVVRSGWCTASAHNNQLVAQHGGNCLGWVFAQPAAAAAQVLAW